MGKILGQELRLEVGKIILTVVLRAGLLPAEGCFCSATGLGENLLGFGAIAFRSEQVLQINPILEQDSKLIKAVAIAELLVLHIALA